MYTNKSLTIFLLNDDVRAISACYDPDSETVTTFKTMDQSISSGDYVVVESDTRHKMTVVKVVDVDLDLDFDTSEKVKWVVGAINKKSHDELIEQESQALDVVSSAEKRRKKDELTAAIVKDNEDRFSKLAIAKVVSE